MAIVSVSGYRFRLSELSFGDIEGMVSRFVDRFDLGDVCLAMDTRWSGYAIKGFVESVLLSRGVTVHDFGILPTPALFREARRIGAGIVVTASHNPLDWNGLKLSLGGRGLFEGELRGMLELGYVERFEAGRIVLEGSGYSNDLVSYLNRPSLKLGIAMDLAGGAGIGIYDRIMKGCGARVVTLNSSMGSLNGSPDPFKRDLEGLKELVVSEGLDMGLAYDPDGDRLVVIDERGERIDGDTVLMLCLLYMAERGAKRFVVSIDTTMAIEELSEEFGFEVIRSRVGEANVVEAMLSNRCEAGGEGSSGGFIASNFNLCRDGMLSSLVLGIVAKEHGGLARLIESLPRYHRVRREVRMDRRMIEKAMKGILERYEGDRVDGIKIEIGGSWVLIRPSNTEDLIRVSVEACREEVARELAGRFVREVEALGSE